MDHEEIPVIFATGEHFMFTGQTLKDIDTFIHKWLYIFIFECLKFMQLFKKL